MSQYIPGIVDYIPQVQPYKPNLNFYQQVLETKNAQYKEGYQQISNLYGNLLESPMLRSENIDLRNKFFNQISSEIAKISGLDLSLSQNINAAQQIFQPLVDNKYILKDMAYTKRAYAELNKAENFKNCIDEKTCGGKYWEGGVRAVQYQMADFAKSSAEDSLGFDAPRYTPAVNIGEKAMKFAKDMGFNMQTVSWSPDGRYKVTTKNGAQMIPSLTDAFLATFQNDQAARDYYNTQGYLSRKDFAYSNADIYGSEEAAESFYLEDMGKKLFDTSSAAYENTQKESQKAKNKQTVYDQVISQRGIDPNNSDDQQMAVDRNQALVDQMILQAAGDQYKQTQEKVNPTTINVIGLEAKRRRIDSAIADALFTNDLAMSAQNYAILTMEQTVDEDKYMLANYDHQLTLSRMKKQKEYDIEVDNAKTANELLVKSYGEGANGGTFEGGSGNLSSNQYKPEPGGPGKGGAAVEADLQKTDESAFTTVTDDMLNGLNGYAKVVNGKLNSILNSEIGAVLIPGDKNNPALKITPELKQWAKEKQLEIFGKAETRSEWVEDDSELGVGGKIANWFLPEKSEYKGYKEVKKTSGGYLDANGNLLTNFSEVEDFSDNSKNNWFKLGQKLNNFVNDPLTKSLFPTDDEIPTAAQNFNGKQSNYNSYLNQIKNNREAVHSATVTSYGDALVKDLISPQHGAQALDKIYSEGRHLTEDEFINWYADNRPKMQKNTPYSYRFGMDTGEDGFYSYNDFKDEGKNLYKQYKERYEKIYNGASDVAEAGKDLSGTKFKPLQYTIQRTDTGSGVQGIPHVISADSAYRGDLGPQDFLSIYPKLSALPSAKFYAADGRDITEDYLDDYEGSQEEAQKVLGLVYSHLTSGKKKTDADRARFDMVVHPVLGNDANTVGITFRLDAEFVEKNQGSAKTPQALRNSSGVYTVVMNKQDAEQLELFQRFKKGPYQMQMDSYGSVTIDQFGKAGTITVVPSDIYEGGYKAQGYLNYSSEDGSEEKLVYELESGPGHSADSFVPQQMELLRQLYIKTMNYSEATRKVNPNLIRNPNLLMPQ
jgi:hypothetical protein